MLWVELPEQFDAMELHRLARKAGVLRLVRSFRHSCAIAIACDSIRLCVDPIDSRGHPYARRIAASPLG